MIGRRKKIGNLKKPSATWIDLVFTYVTNRLLLLQKRAARSIAEASHRSHTDYIFKVNSFHIA